MQYRIAVAFTMVLGCGGGDVAFDPEFEAPGPYVVGNATVELTDATRGRALTVEIWYPAADSARDAAVAGEPVEAFVRDADDRTSYADLLAAAPSGCPSTSTASARDAPVAPADGAWPLLVFSHCHNCVRFSAFSVAERLASFGFVVAAPGHAGNTLFDDLAGTAVELDAAFLQVRAADIRFVLDALLDDGSALPPDLRGALDPDRVGVFGHSFGGVTTGLVLQDDPRPRAGLSITSPMENPLLEGVELTAIDRPIGFIVAVEDNSITELGNVFIRRNFEDALVPAWKAEVADAGHWSFSNICGLHENFSACCGAGERQTDLTPFEYLDLATGIGLAQAYAVAFFRAHLMDDASARRYLQEPRPAATVSIEQHD